jgi:protein dithiol oxidoreductase (disulfide-forming)
MTISRRPLVMGLVPAGLSLSMGGAQAQGGPVSGVHYVERQGPALPPGQPNRIDVIEFFWYGCPHCYAFEPLIEPWAKQAAADVNFRRVHVQFRANMKGHQRMFFALEALGLEHQARPAIFAAIHRQGQMLESIETQTSFLTSLGIDGAKFQSAWKSMGVATRCQQADRLAEAYDIDGVPSLGVAGRFLTSPGMQSGGQRLPEAELGARAIRVLDFLLQRQRTAR